MELEDGRVVASVPLSAGREVRLRLVELWNGPYLDLRLFYANGEGECFPTKKGVTIPVSSLPRLRSALEALDDSS
jgi:hypothetical protein